MTSIEQLKKQYESGEWVCYLFNNHSNKWLKPYWWDFHTDTYKLIHKKHEHIADAVIANPDVEVEWLIEPKGVTTAEDMFTPRWERRVLFFDTYDSTYEYCLRKESKSKIKDEMYETLSKEEEDMMLSKNQQDFNHEYIVASQEAYDLLVEAGYKSKYISYIENWDYMYIKDDNIDYCDDDKFIQVMDEQSITNYKQFYINNGKLSWEKPQGEDDGNNNSELLHFNSTDSTDNSNSSTSSGMGMEETISITDSEGVEYSFNTHGYEIKFYDLLENVIHGAIKCQGGWYSCEWSRFTGNLLKCTDEDVSEGDFNLNPIKPKWYDNPDNFPAVMTNEESFQVVDLIEFDEHFRHWRLATRAELHSLYVEEK